MRLKRLILMAVGAALIAVGFAVPSQASLTTFCNGVASDVTVPGDLVVRAGASCELTNVTINGNATVRADANLLLDDSTVQGNLRVNADGFASLVDSHVAGNTRLVGAYGVYSEGSVHELNVVATDSEFFYTLGADLQRNVTSTNAETFLEESWVSRNVTSEGSYLTDLHDSVVEGNVSVTGAELGSVVCLSEIDGDASFTGNTGLVQIGANGPVQDCGFNVFGGDLTLTGNQADSFVSNNVIRGDLVCSDNSPAPVVSDNRIRGAENCDTSAAAALSSRSSRALATAAADRKDEVLDAIEAKVADGEKAAAEAGPAFE
ncbi:hypothetical protein [Phytoactinopolyspora limicola]|uniref:hypothetical protein n=1 Tax=Phytoactinopolyspora limicola TaxID=2715536 RepID=UPI0014098949|nr:hypothetical protein [Phytoactinopolyspora limicola]